MSEEEAIKRLNYFKTISILYGDTFAMSIEELKQLQKDIETALQLLEQKDTRIDELEKALVDEAIKSTEKIKELNNKINKVKEYCNETIDFKDNFNEKYDDCYDILKMLED